MGGDFIGEIHFFTHTTDGYPPCLGGSILPNGPVSNFAPLSTRLTIHDLRGKEKNFDLDRNAFELHRYDRSIQDALDENTESQRIYFDEVVSILKKRLGASRVIVVNHIFHYRGSSYVDDECDAKYKNPSIIPHVDYELPSALLKVREALGEDEANKVMRKRFQLITIWHPIGRNPIKHRPLIVCDYLSVDALNDVHSLEIRGSPASVSGLTISCNTSDAQKWYYQSDMKSDEMFLMKMFDSTADVAQFCFHTSFKNEHTSPSNDQQKKS